ncbi:MAG: hypothetical protein AAGK37_04255 [Pseudomonadota bacterium]
MAEDRVSNLRFRGIDVVVDTTRPAEFDIADHRLGTDAVEAIASELKEVTFSTRDRTLGTDAVVRVREIRGFDVVYAVGREDAKVVVTIAAALRPNDNEPTEILLERLNAVAILRSAFGL